MAVRRYDIVGIDIGHTSPNGAFVLYSDYEAALKNSLSVEPAELYWASSRDQLTYMPMYEAITPFGTSYSMIWAPEGEDENPDPETAPFWSAWHNGPEDAEPYLATGTFAQARLVCANDYLIRVAQTLGYRIEEERIPQSERAKSDAIVQTMLNGLSGRESDPPATHVAPTD